MHENKTKAVSEGLEGSDQEPVHRGTKRKWSDNEFLHSWDKEDEDKEEEAVNDDNDQQSESSQDSEEEGV